MENLAMKELERGREVANQLRRLIFRSGDEEDDDKVNKGLTTSSAEDLAAKLLDSFTDTLSLFNSNHHLSADSSMSSFSHLPANSDESHEISKTRSPSSIKDRTRCTPRKRKSTAQTWEEDTEKNPKQDGHAWRKYGQKIILNSKHPRNYFRCTHKFDQGCEATKQVQKIQDHPPLYRTTYFGHHTCTNLLNPQSILDSHDDLNSTSAFILSFNNNITTTFDQKLNNNNNNNSCSLFPSAGSVKKEDQHCHISNIDIVKQEKNNVNVNVNVVPSCSSNDYCLVSADEEEAVLPFGSGDDQVVDVFSSAVFYDPLVLEDPFLFAMI